MAEKYTLGKKQNTLVHRLQRLTFIKSSLHIFVVRKYSILTKIKINLHLGG